MNKKEKNSGLNIVDLALIGFAGFAAYQLLAGSKQKPVNNRADAIKVILHYKPSADLATLQTADEGYIIARANAFIAAQPIYIFNGRQYYTVSGMGV